MFKKYTKEQLSTIMPTISMPPMKKEFKVMIELIRDAEKYDNAGDKEISICILDVIKKHIDSLTNK